MRRLSMLSLVAVLVAVMAAPVSAKKPDPTELPLMGEFSGRLIGFGAVEEGRCDATPEGKVAWAVTSFEGWGTATHLGKAYVYAEHCSYADEVTGPDGTYGEGEFTITADNGDILLGTYTNGVSLSPPPIIGFMDDMTFINGGTGRFSYASGGGVEMGSVNFNDFSFSMQMTGLIAYSKK